MIACGKYSFCGDCRRLLDQYELEDESKKRRVDERFEIPLKRK